MFKRLINKFKKIVPVKIAVSDSTLFQNQTILIFGGTGDIGRSIGERMISSGASTVIFCGTNKAVLEEISKEKNSIAEAIDVTNVSEMEKKIISLFNVYSIDVFVYAAGIHGEDPFGKVTESTWDKVMNVNLKGLYFATQCVSRLMEKKNIKGHILLIGSASSTKPGWTPYEISKTYIKSLTQGFASKLISSGIIVNSIAPGPVATKMIHANEEDLKWAGNPAGRTATVDEVANLALFLASREGDMVVGDTVFLSGGSGTICLDK